MPATGVRSMKQPITGERQPLMSLQDPQSINDIRTAIRELSARADLARKEGRSADAAELDRRTDSYREELSNRP